MNHLSPTLLSALESVKAIVLFPLWWYTVVISDKAKEAWQNLEDCRRLLHLRILLQHMSSPLYGTKGWEAKAFSILIRCGHFLYHLTVTLCFTAFFVAWFLLWLLAPVVVLWNLAFQIGITNLSLYELFVS